MKTIIFTVVLITSLFSGRINAQDNEALLEAPEGWRSEVLKLPLGFAPELEYTGTEYVRFAKGWGDANSEEFWTYKFAWYLDADPKLTTERLNKELKLYFDGLMQLVGKGKGLSKEIITPTKTTIVYDKDKSSFTGTAIIFDVFFNEALQTLNVKINSTYCDVLKKHIAYFEFSPQPLEHQLWKTMESISIRCK